MVGLLLLLLLLPNAVLLGNSPAFIASESSTGTTLTLAVDDFQSQSLDRSGYSLITHPNASYPIDEGSPSLPYFTTFIQIPATGNVALRVEGFDTETLNDQVPPPTIGEGRSSAAVENAALYAASINQPVAEIGDPAILRDLRVVPLRMYPFVYDQAQQATIFRRNIRITVESTGGAGTNELPATRRLMSRSFQPFYEAMVANYHRDENNISPLRTILVICPNSAAVTDIVNQYADWKRRKGFEVTVATLTQTGSTSTAIRNYITNAYNNWDNPPDYITIFGDANGSISVPTNFETISTYHGETDFPYVLLDGSDMLPEAFVGRISVSTTTELQTFWAKITNYEINPYMTNTAWYGRTLLVSDLNNSGVTTNFTNQFVKEMIHAYDPDHTFLEISGYSPDPWDINQDLNSGVLTLSYRGIGGLGGWEVSDIESLSNGLRLINGVIITCNTGSFSDGTSRTEAWIRRGTPSAPQGGISCIGMATNGTHTAFNNCLSGGIFYGLYADQMWTMGEALMRGKLNLYMNYYGTSNWNNSERFMYWCNLMGDPSLDIWKSLPQTLNTNCPTTLSTGSSSIQIRCLDGSNQPIENAWVTIRNSTAGFYSRGYTDANGYVRLSLDTDLTGTLNFTATKPGYKPRLSDITFSNNSIASLDPLVYGDTESSTTHGNADGYPNAGETIGLSLPIRNLSAATLSGVSVSVSTAGDPYITWSDSTAVYPAISVTSAAPNSDPLLFTISPATPNNHQVWLAAIITSSSGSTTQYIPITIRGVDLDVTLVSVVDGNNSTLDPGESVSLNITIANNGTAALTNVVAELTSIDGLVTITDSQAAFGTVTAGGTTNCSANPFSITANAALAPGMTIQCRLSLSNTTGYAETETFTLPVGIADVHDPLGPDAHGYYCYDDGDTDYLDCPEYDWIELNPAQTPDYTGTNLNISDSGDDGDMLVGITLPFSFRFYGQDFTTAQVCSNGFLTFLDTASADFRNGRLPGPLGPSGMIAAFWDDLYTNNNSRVLTYNDATNHRFIIEWSRMRNFYNGSEETFEIVLYDPIYDPTTLGDGKIMIQYRTFNNVDVGYSGSDSPVHGNYSTIGLEDPTAEIGLEYTWNNTYPTAASPLGNSRAILFSGPPVVVNSPSLMIDEVAVNGVVTSDIESGTTAQCEIVVRNNGLMEATGVTATLTTTNGSANITHPVTSLGNIPAGGIATALATISIAETCPDGTVLPFSLALQSTNGSWDCPFEMLSVSALLTLSNLTLSSGIAVPGQTAQVSLSCANTGHMTAASVMALLWSNDPYVTVSSGQYSVGTLSAGQTFSQPNAFTVTFDANMPAVYSPRLNVLLTTSTGEYIVAQVDVSTIATETFENGAANWSHYTTNGSATDEWHLSSQRCYSTSTSYKVGSTSPTVDYSNNMSCALESPEIILPDSTYFIFRHWMEAEDSPSQPGYGYDGGIVQIESNGTWETITPLQGYPMLSLEGTNPPFPLGTSFYCGDIDWGRAVFSLAGYSGATHLRFYFGTDNAYRREGWYIDDVQFSNTPGLLTAPSGLLAEVVDDASVHLTWSASTGDVSGYNVYRRIAMNAYTRIGTTTNREFTDTDIPDSVAYYLVTANDGQEESHFSNTVEGHIPYVNTHNSTVPALEDRLAGNFPNPFNPETTISFSLAQAGIAQIDIFNLRGQRVRTLVKDNLPAGAHTVTWNGTDDNGRAVASGVYLYRLDSAGKQKTRKCLLLK